MAAIILVYYSLGYQQINYENESTMLIFHMIKHILSILSLLLMHYSSFGQTKFEDYPKLNFILKLFLNEDQVCKIIIAPSDFLTVIPNENNPEEWMKLIIFLFFIALTFLIEKEYTL